MFKVNPYRPGTGLKPIYLAGRDKYIQRLDEYQKWKESI